MAGVSAGARQLPAPGLRAFVRSYTGYELRGFAPGIHIGMPSPYLTVVITLGAPIDIPQPCEPSQAGGSWVALASGISARPCTIAHNGNQYGMQLELTPAGARALFGMPAGELGSWIVELSDVLGPRTAELRERLALAADWRRRFRILDEILLDRATTQSIDPHLSRAWTLLTGAVPAQVAATAADVGWSARHLRNQFTAEFGITPKDSARISRFTTAHQLLRTPAPAPLAAIAARSGYYDQAHMAREWRELAGMAPSRWRANEQFLFVQDAGPPAAQYQNYD